MLWHPRESALAHLGPSDKKRTFCPSRSSKYAGNAPSLTAPSSFCLTFRSSCALSVFFSWTFSECRLAWCILALCPTIFCVSADALCASRAVRFRLGNQREAYGAIPPTHESYIAALQYSLSLLMVQAATIPLTVLLHVLILHNEYRPCTIREISRDRLT